MISLQTSPAAAPLRRFIKSFWYLQVDAPLPVCYEEDIVPDGHYELIFHLHAGAAKRKTETGDLVTEPIAFIAAQNLKSYTLQLQPGAVLYGIRFYPHTLPLLFNIPATAIHAPVLALSEFTNAVALFQCPTSEPVKTFNQFERFFIEKINNTGYQQAAFYYVEAAVQEINKSRGHLTIDRLTRYTGISGKHLDNLFQKYVGLNPKVLCNIFKLNYFINYKKSHPSATLTQCAYEAGFYDQSHLIKLFTSFTGRPPKNYFAQTNYISNQFAGM